MQKEKRTVFVTGASFGIRVNAVAFCIAFIFAAVTFISLTSGSAAAQSYPNKVIRVIFQSPGGNTDIIFRVLAPRMEEVLGRQLVFEYHPGSGGIAGMDITAKSPPDGYTTSVVASSFLFNPALIKNLPFDTIKDFTPLGLVAEIGIAMVVHPSLPAKDVKEFIALAKARPGQLFFSSTGPGTSGHLTGELFNSLANIKLVHVGYRGLSPSIIELVGGHVHVSFPGIPSAIQYVRSGKLRMIAQCGATRSPSSPEVPTVQEAGVPGFVVVGAFGFVGPAGLPAPIVEKLNSALTKALNDPANRKQLIDMGTDPVGSTPAKHAAYINAEIEKWKKVATQAGIKSE